MKVKLGAQLLLVGCSLTELGDHTRLALWNHFRIWWLFKFTRQKKILKNYKDRDDVERSFPDNAIFIRSSPLMKKLDESYEDYKYGLTYFLDRYRLDDNLLPLRKRRRMVPLAEWYGLK